MFIVSNLSRLVASLLIAVVVVQTPAHSVSPVDLFAAQGLAPQVFGLALKAHQKAVLNGDIKNPNVITIIDYSLPSNEKRMWVLDLNTKQVLHHTYVAHGKKSGQLYAKNFSNQVNSHKSSYGVYKTGGTYVGKHGRSLNLHGLEKWNSNAYKRRVVLHGSSYVNATRAKNKTVGRSLGCPAVDTKIAQKIIDSTKDGTMIFAYYPAQEWLDHSTYLV